MSGTRVTNNAVGNNPDYDVAGYSTSEGIVQKTVLTDTAGNPYEGSNALSVSLYKAETKLLDTSDTPIDPATDGTLRDIKSNQTSGAQLTQVRDSVGLNVFENAASLSDAISNPTCGIAGAANLVWDGANWRRMKADATNGVAVDVKKSALPSGAATETTLAAPQKTAKIDSGTTTTATAFCGQLDDTTPTTISENDYAVPRLNPTRDLHVCVVNQAGVYSTLATNTTLTTTNSNLATIYSAMTDGVSTFTQINSGSSNANNTLEFLSADYDTGAGDVRTSMFGIALPASGGPVIGGTTTNPVVVNDAPQATGGHSKYHLISAGTTNATVVKASAGQLYGYDIFNNAAAHRKVAFHNSASSPTAGASIFFSVSIGAGQSKTVYLDKGIAFSAGIAITTVTGIADADTAAVTASDLNINLFYT